MLTQWSLENFKSFAGRTDITLAPITVFAGANSSGKSTIIQSILLLKQTVQYAPINRPLALNGPLLKLGTFDDIKNSSVEATHVGVAWEMDVEDLTQSQRTSSDYYSLSYPYFYFGPMNAKSVRGQFEWDVAPPKHLAGPVVNQASSELLQLYPRLAASSLEAVLVEKESIRMEIALARSDKPAKSGGRFAFAVKAIDDKSRAEVFGTKPSPTVAGAGVRHFLPAQIGVEYDSTLHRARLIASLLTRDELALSWDARQFNKEEIQVDQAREILKLVYPKLQAKDYETILGEASLSLGRGKGVSVDVLSRGMRSLRTAYLRNAASAKAALPTLDDIRPDIERVLVGDTLSNFLIEPTIPRPLAESVQYVAQYFTSAVRYLGPLRDEPKPMYPLEALTNPTEVGYKGEHTAAVFDLNRDRRIRYLPSSFIQGHKLNTNLAHGTLHDAVVDWLAYVGVASEVSSFDRGKMGHALQVQTEGLNRFHDLTNVGVGVSQVLPIIVMALLAESPTILIFEQPELHLHPKVQARLADFFLSVALIGKQCLLETHSEYLIDRFRRRVAMAEGDTLTKLLKIYFTERENGTSRCQEVEISKYGAIATWPKDFFDQSQIETESILQAAAAKRLQEKLK